MEHEHGDPAEERRREEINEIGRAVKVARNGRGWSLRRLAENAGLSASLLSAVETGKIVPTVGSLFAISDAFGEPAETFFPARRRTTAPGSDDIVSDRPGSGEDHHEPGLGPGQQVDPAQNGASFDPTSASPQLPPATAATSPPPVRGTSSGNAPLTADRSFEDASPAPPRSIVRPARIIARRPVPTPSAKAVPIRPAPVHDAKALFGRRPREGAPLVPDRQVHVPGVVVRRANERPTMVFEDETVWSLPVEAPDAVRKVVEVSIPSGLEPSSRHRVRDRATTILVSRGRLWIDAAFVETTLEAGDSAVIAAGVPHRLMGDQQQSTTYLAFVSGAWDGTL